MIEQGKIKTIKRKVGKKSIKSVDLRDFDRVEVRLVAILTIF